MTVEFKSWINVLRGLAAFAALPFACVALIMLRNEFQDRFIDLLSSSVAVCATAVAYIGCWFALRSNYAAVRLRIGIVLLGGIILGAIGFIAGFAGPIIFMPRANQGPLLGIFITGPLGFFLGAVIGWIFGYFRLNP